MAQFMKELAKHKGKFKIVKSWSSIGCRYSSNLRAGCNPGSACPITKVYASRCGKPVGCRRYLEAAKKMGISQWTADTIARAADAPETSYDLEIRKQMLEVLNLKEIA